MNAPIFGIDQSKFKHLGMMDPQNRHTLEAFDSAQLSTEERLFFRLLSSGLLRTGLFDLGSKLATAGEHTDLAHVIVTGQVVASNAKDQVLMGPGSVIGLAEGLAQVPSSWNVVAQTTVNTRIIPIARALREIQGTNAGLRGVCRITVLRILGLKHVPESLN